MTKKLVDEISKIHEDEIEMILSTVLERYAVLFPNWEVSTISIQKNSNRNKQIDQMIAMLQNLKDNP